MGRSQYLIRNGWPVIQLIVMQVVLGRVRQEAADDEQGDVRTFGCRPGQQGLKLLGWDPPLVPLAVNEPGLQVPRAVDVSSLMLSDDVSAAVGRVG
jgi:hypothetical protein